MLLAEVLDYLNQDDVKGIARKLGVPRNGLKLPLCRRVATALHAKTGSKPPQGYPAALEALLDLLDEGGLSQLTYSSNWWAEEGELEVDMDLIDGASRQELRDFARPLLLSLHAENPEAEVSRLWHSEEFGQLLTPVFDADDEEDGEDASEDHGEDAWLDENLYEAGPGTEPALPAEDKPLYPHQTEALAALNRWWGNPKQKAGVLCLPTGAGKTRTAAAFILRTVLQTGVRILWLAHRAELVDQALHTFLRTANDSPGPFVLGRFQSGSRKHEETASITVASIQTVAHGGKDLPNLDLLLETNHSYDLIVVDECHHAVAPQWSRLLKELKRRLPKSRLLGLSATPTRTDKAEQPALWKLFGEMIHEARALPLIRDGILARPNVVAIETGRVFAATPEQQTWYRKFKDLPPTLLHSIGANSKRNKLIVEFLAAKAPKERKHTLLFAVDIEHAEKLAAMLERQGINADALHSGTPLDERGVTLRQFTEGKVEVLVNVGLFTEGTDLPKVQNVVVARPSRSRILFQQMVGRGLRGPKLGGTAECNVIGFFDNIQGLVADQLTSSFSDEQQMLEALGLEEQKEVETLLGPSFVVEAEDGPDLAPALQRFEAALALALEATPAGQVTPASQLLGWWECSSRAARHFLPVFTGDSELASSLVARICSGQGLGAGDWEWRFLRDEDVERFVAALRDRTSGPTFVELSRATPEELRLAVASVRGAEPLLLGSDAPAAPPPQAHWRRRARALLEAAQAPEPHVALELPSGPIQLSQAAYEALQGAWTDGKAMLASKDPAAVATFVATLLQFRVPEAAKAHPSAAELLRHAAATGDLPQVVTREAAPTPPAILAELRAANGTDKAALLEAVRQAYFPTPDAWVQFQSAMLVAR